MFSGAVKIGDLNDFIAPSQACVVSLEGGKLAAAADAEVRRAQGPGQMLAARKGAGSAPPIARDLWRARRGLRTSPPARHTVITAY